MAIRTTAAAVKLVLRPGKDYGTEEDPDTGDDLTPFMETAAALVDDLVAYGAEDEISVPAARAELVERWLSAHFYVMSRQVEASKSLDGTSSTFQGQTGKNLEASKYGQTAIDLDPTGFLSDGTSFSLDWGGKPTSEQIPIEDRD